MGTGVCGRLSDYMVVLRRVCFFSIVVYDPCPENMTVRHLKVQTKVIQGKD